MTFPNSSLLVLHRKELLILLSSCQHLFLCLHLGLLPQPRFKYLLGPLILEAPFRHLLFSDVILLFLLLCDLCHVAVLSTWVERIASHGVL